MNDTKIILTGCKIFHLKCTPQEGEGKRGERGQWEWEIFGPFLGFMFFISSARK